MKKPLPVRTQIRIPQELHTKLVEEAQKNHSSLNDALIFYIERGFSNKTPFSKMAIPLSEYMEKEMMKIIESNLALAQGHFQQLVSEKIDILQNITQNDIDEFLKYKLENQST